MNFTDNIKQTVVSSLEWLRTRIIENHQAANQQASGRTIRSLLIEETEAGAKLKGRQAFATLEAGRKGGKVPYNFNQIIEQWIIDKGIAVKPIPYKRKPSDNWQPKYTPQQRGLMSLAGAIAHTIAKEGTSLYRNNERLDIFSKPSKETVRQIKEKLTGIFKVEIEKL